MACLYDTGVSYREVFACVYDTIPEALLISGVWFCLCSFGNGCWCMFLPGMSSDFLHILTSGSEGLEFL